MTLRNPVQQSRQSVVLRVIRVLGQQAPIAISARFDAPGGTIGRAADNTLALPDPLRQISRLHARIEITEALSTIICLSSGGAIVHNGQSLAQGQSSPLEAGDTLIMGGFEMVVESESLPKAVISPTDVRSARTRGLDTLFDLVALADQKMSVSAAADGDVIKQVVPTAPSSPSTQSAQSARSARTTPTKTPSPRRQSSVREPTSRKAGKLPSSPPKRKDDGLESLLLGLGLDELPGVAGREHLAPAAITPALLEKIGALLRVSAAGTVALLQYRAMVKREMRTDVTMIQAHNNNPLKFSTDARSALTYLMSPDKIAGFLEPQAALHDAYQDLLGHQLAFMAGMRAAAARLIERFDPALLEERLSRKLVMDAVWPGGRKARLWELFNEQFAELSGEARDDFETCFGREFAKAYEQQSRSIAQPGVN